MMLLIEQEIRDIACSVKDIGENSDRALILAAQKAVIAKIKAQGPVAWAATSEEGVVEALGFNQSKSRFVTPLYRLPEGD